MIRRTVYLEEDLAIALRRFAELEDRSESEIIHDALRQYFADACSWERPPIAGLGGYRSGRSDVSGRSEDLLRECGQR